MNYKTRLIIFFLVFIFNSNLDAQTQTLTPCPDLTSVVTVVPSTISSLSSIAFVAEIVELNQIDTDGSAIIVRIPSDERLTFTWDPTLTTVAFIPVQNAIWSYLGNNGLYHEFQYGGTILTAGNQTAFGILPQYDPQVTSGQTNITVTVVLGSGGECVFTNNSNSEMLVYFD